MTSVAPLPLSPPTRSVSAKETPLVTRVVVHQRAFRRWWLLVVSIHCLCGAFLVVAGTFYRYLDEDSVAVDFAIYQIAVDAKYFPSIASMYFCLASVHGVFVASLVLARVDRWSAWTRFQRRVPRWMSVSWRLARAFSAAFDVRHKNYGLVFLVREIVLTFLQSVQTYRLSCLASRLWMNNVMASLLVLNCWATPLLQYAFRSRVGYIRLSNAIVNLLLDMVSYIVLPIALVMPYTEQFMPSGKQFGHIFWYTDAWFIRLINEVQLVFVTSLYDAISRCVIILSVVRNLHAVTKLVCVADSIDQIEALGRHLLFLWGLIVFVAHVYALSLPNYNQCRLPTRPWFGTKPGCSLLEIDCAVERFTGTRDNIDRLLNNFDLNRIEYLVVRNCPLLQLPPRIQSLSELLGLKIFNSTILRWDQHAALTSTHHPKLRFLFVVASNMRELPIGLQSPDFPPTLRDIEFSRTNLSVIPDHLDAIWPKRMFLAFEESELQEIPSVLLRLRPFNLLLGLNHITSVPRELLEEFQIRLLFLDGNPLDRQSFPSTLSKPPQIGFYGLARTNISELPEWVDDNVLASSTVVLAETPLCDRLIAAKQASKNDLRSLKRLRGIDCSLSYFPTGTLNWYPIDYEDVINPTYSLA